MLLNRSIIMQFALVFVIALTLVVGSFYLVLESVYRSELKSQAETVADNVDAFGNWVSQYGRVWVKDDNKSYLGQVTLVNPADSGVPADQWHFYSKNPALAQREFSEVVEKSTSPAKFRMRRSSHVRCLFNKLFTLMRTFRLAHGGELRFAPQRVDGSTLLHRPRMSSAKLQIHHCFR